MIAIKNVKKLDGQLVHFEWPSRLDYQLDAEGRLSLFPGWIDAHISLGPLSSENWQSRVESAIRGGVGTLLDLPTKDAPSSSKEQLAEKKIKSDQRFCDLNMPVTYFPYAKANSEYMEELGFQKALAMGAVILFEGSDHFLEDHLFDRIFQIAAWEDLPVILNTRGENSSSPHGKSEGIPSLLEKAIFYAEKQNARLCVFNVATQEELQLIREARQRALLIYAETTLKQLFPRTPSKSDFLWEALASGEIEAIGSGWCREEAEQERLLWRGAHFEFLNPIFFLPLLFTAHRERKLSLELMVRLIKLNYYDMFKLEKKENHFVLVDLDKQETLERYDDLGSQAITLQGWPELIILGDHLFQSKPGSYHLDCLH